MTGGAGGRCGGIGAVGRNLVIRLLHRLGPVTDVVPDLVGSEVAAREPRAGLQADDVEPRLGERECRHATGRAQADDHDVRGSERLRHALLNMSESYAERRCRAGTWPSR